MSNEGGPAESPPATGVAAVAPEPEPATFARGALWHWDLKSGRVEWDEKLKTLFGYVETVTDAAWRESLIHPEDRDRVKVSLQRATIVNQGSVWSEQYRFRHADGSYVHVSDRAYVLQDDAGPRGVLGAMTPMPTGTGVAASTA